MLPTYAPGSDFQNHLHYHVGMIEIDEKDGATRRRHLCCGTHFFSGELDIMYPIPK